MKKLLVLALTLVTGVSVFGQGRFLWGNSTAAATTYLYTNNVQTSARGVISGSQQYYIGIFLGANTADFSAAAAPALYATNSAALTGRFGAGQVNVDGAQTFQVRAWSASLGNTWAQVAPKVSATGQLLPGNAGYFGYSAIGSVTPTVAPTAAPTIWGTGAGQITGFDLFSAVPEPSTLALGGLGLFGLYLIRRRK